VGDDRARRRDSPARRGRFIAVSGTLGACRQAAAQRQVPLSLMPASISREGESASFLRSRCSLTGHCRFFLVGFAYPSLEYRQSALRIIASRFHQRIQPGRRLPNPPRRAGWTCRGAGRSDVPPILVANSCALSPRRPVATATILVRTDLAKERQFTTALWRGG
jgi:hypothetical protein